MLAPRKKRLTPWQMFTLGLATFGGAKAYRPKSTALALPSYNGGRRNNSSRVANRKAANSSRVVPYSNGSRKSTGLTAVTTNANFENLIKQLLPNSKILAVKTQRKLMSNNSKREQNYQNSANLLFPPTNNASKPKFKPTPRNTFLNVKRRLGIIRATPGEAKNVLNALSNEKIVEQTLAHMKNGGKNVSIRQTVKNQTMKLKNLQNKKNENLKKNVNQKRKNLQGVVNRITANLPRLQSSNSGVQKMINSSRLQINTTYIENVAASIENILVLPDIENIKTLVKVLDDDSVPLTRNAIKALGAIQANAETLQNMTNIAKRNLNNSKRKSNENMQKHKNSSQFLINTRILNGVGGSLDSIQQAKISKQHVKLTKKDVEIYQRILNGTLTNEIKKAYLYSGVMSPDKNGNSLLIAIFYYYTRDFITDPELRAKLALWTWEYIIFMPKDLKWIHKIFLILFKCAIPPGIILLLKVKGVKTVLAAMILMVTGMLYGTIKFVSVETFVQQIVSMAEVLTIYKVPM